MTTSGTARTGWMQAFTQRRKPNGFLSRFFTVKPGGQFYGDEIELDIERYSEDVAVVVTPGSGARQNDTSPYTTKKFKPPTYNEGRTVNVNDLLSRMAGEDPHSAAYKRYASKLVAESVKGASLLDDKIKRALELQASQVLQTGILDLQDSGGNTLFSLDFAMKSAHKPDADATWATSSSDAIGDLLALAKLIRSNGKIDPNMLIMGEAAMSYFLANDDVKTRLDNRRMELGGINPRFADSGATRFGDIWIGTYRFEIWAYPEEYKHPQTGSATQYVGTNNVIMLSDRTRLDRVSAAVPLPLGQDPRVAGLFPGRLSGSEFDVTPNLYCSPNGKEIKLELETRTLMVPAQIDGFGCLNVVP